MPKGMQSSQSVAELFQHSRKPFKTTFSLDTRAFGNPLSVQLSVGNKRCNRLNVDHYIRNGFLLQENSSEIRTASSKVKNYGDTGTPVYKCDDETKQIQL